MMMLMMRSLRQREGGLHGYGGCSCCRKSLGFLPFLRSSSCTRLRTQKRMFMFCVPYMHPYVRTYVRTYTLVYVCIRAYTYICTCLYTHNLERNIRKLLVSAITNSSLETFASVARFFFSLFVLKTVLVIFFPFFIEKLIYISYNLNI
jgi:hypothetical protein